MSKKLLLNFILIAAFSAPPLTVWLTTAAAQQPAAKADSDATVESFMSQQRRPERMNPLGTHAPSRASMRGRVRTQGFPEERKEQKPGSIKGRVVGDDGQPMANVPVVAAPVGRAAARRPGPSGRAAQTNTDDDGVFEFEGLAPASYAISASAPGYITPPPIEGENSPGVYRIGDFANVTLARGGVITGKVTNAVGEHLTGVSVNAIRVGDPDGENQLVFQGFGRNWRTDDRGIYRIYGLVPGSYVIQAGGSRGAGPNPLSPFSGDAPTYYPSSARDVAVPVSVRAGEEVTGIDIRYRGDKGRVVSGRSVAKAGDGGFGAIQIVLSVAGSDAAVAMTVQMDAGRRNAGRMNSAANRGFAFYGVPDGEYEIVARRSGLGAESDAVSAQRRVSVRGADVGGIELTLTPLASISGRVVVEKKAAVCQKPRASSIEEILLTAERDEARVPEATLASRLTEMRPAAPNVTGEFTLLNLEAGRHRLIAQLPDENWYVRAIGKESRQPTTGARRTVAPAPINIARNGATLKLGEKLTGITVTIAEDAAAVIGRVVVDQDGKLPGKVRAHLIPAEKEAADDFPRYAQANVSGDGGFIFKNIAPGRYYLVAKPIKADAGVSPRLQAWDNAERAALRKEAEAAGNVIELQSCQRIDDYKLSIQSH